MAVVFAAVSVDLSVSRFSSPGPGGTGGDGNGINETGGTWSSFAGPTS
eukprot:gene26168-11307_t